MVLNSSDDVLSLSKTLRAGTMKNLGCVQVQLLNLLEQDSIEPDSTLNLSLDITNSSKSVKFHKIQISVREVQTWTSMIKPKTGNNPTMMEITKLSKQTICDWDIVPIVDKDTGKKQRLVQLHDLKLDIPESTNRDRPYGLLRINHYLQVKLTSDGAIINNLRFRFPLVIGGEQYETIPDDHPIHKIRRGNKSLSKALAYGIARTIIVASQGMEYAFNRPIGAVKEGVAKGNRRRLTNRRLRHNNADRSGRTIGSPDEDESDREVTSTSSPS